MTKFVDSLGLKRLVTKIAEAVGNGTWLPVKKGESEGSVVMGENTIAIAHYSHAEGTNTTTNGIASHAEGTDTTTIGSYSHAEGCNTMAEGEYSHAEGCNTMASGKYSHAQGSFNYDDSSFINMVGVGDEYNDKNAFAIYVGRDPKTNELNPSDSKKWLSVSTWCWWI